MSHSDDHALAHAGHDLGPALRFGGTVPGVAGGGRSGGDLPGRGCGTT